MLTRNPLPPLSELFDHMKRLADQMKCLASQKTRSAYQVAGEVKNWRVAVLLLLYVLIVLGTVYRAWVIIEYNPMDHVWSDPQRHWEQGTQTLRTDPMTMTDPVMYQLFVAALGKLTLGIPQLVAFYTILLSIFTPWIWYRFFRLLQPSRLIAVAGWVAITWLPSWTTIYSYFMQETLMLPLLGLSLYQTWRCKKKESIKTFGWMIFLWAIAGLTRGICIPLAAVASLWLWLVQKQKIQKAVLSILVLVSILGPLTYRSYEMMNIFAPHGIGQMNMIYQLSGKEEVKIYYKRDGAGWLFGFMSPSLRSKPLEPLSDWTSQREGTVTIDIDVANGGDDWNKAFEKLDFDLERYLWTTKENLIFLFFGSSWPDNNVNHGAEAVGYYMRWIWAPLFGVAIIWFVFAIRRQRHHLLLPSLILAWFVLQGLSPLVVNEGRYRKPFEGLLIAQLVLLAGTTCSRRCSRKSKALPESEQEPESEPEMLPAQVRV